MWEIFSSGCKNCNLAICCLPVECGSSSVSQTSGRLSWVLVLWVTRPVVVGSVFTVVPPQFPTTINVFAGRGGNNPSGRRCRGGGAAGTFVGKRDFVPVLESKFKQKSSCLFCLKRKWKRDSRTCGENLEWQHQHFLSWSHFHLFLLTLEHLSNLFWNTCRRRVQDFTGTSFILIH